ncbi:MAG: substrate-binding domain-containing protein [Phycisphaerae bacterium]|nr:substrate-binding domain-containing protein [Phycisphaerae bacterium]
MRPFSQARVDQLVAVLRRQLRRHIPGSRLPSRSSLSRRFGAPVWIVRQAVALLERQGVVECHPGGGVFVTEHAAAAAGVIRDIHTFCFNRRDFIYDELLLGIDRQCKRHWLKLHSLATDPSSLQPDSLADLCGGDPAAAGWLFLYCTPPEDCILPWQLRGIVFASISDRSRAGCYAAVSCDSRGAIYQAAERLILLGHQRIAFVGTPAGSSWTATCRSEGFRLAHARHGLEIQPESQWAVSVVQRSDWSPLVSQWWPRFQPTAIVAADQKLGCDMILGCEAMGLRVPEDVSVISGGLRRREPPRQLARLSRMEEGSPEDLGRAAVDLLLEAHATGNLPTVLLPATWIDCGSTARPRE